jgi:guanylate kinase
MSSGCGPEASTSTEHDRPMKAGPLIIVSGASGSGKSTVVGRLLRESGLPLRLSVSATTRQPRPGEEDGRAYHYWTAEQFEKAVGQDAFLEHASVHGNCYGTLKAEVEPYRAQGVGVILEIDVQGATAVRQKCPVNLSIFVRAAAGALAEELAELKKRLESRGTDNAETIQRRLAGARRELERAGEYDHVVINDDQDTAVTGLAAIIRRQFS